MSDKIDEKEKGGKGDEISAEDGKTKDEKDTETKENVNKDDETPSSSPSASAASRKADVHKQDYEKDTVYVYQFERLKTCPSMSPFCLKLETWLRVAGLKYENVENKMKYWSKKGQLPFVEVNGKEINDSVIIIRELSKQFDKDLDGTLTKEEQAISHAFYTTLDHHTGWILRWWRYSNPGEFMKAAGVDPVREYYRKIPGFLLSLIFRIKLKGALKKTKAHGIGLNSADEIFEFGKTDLKHLSDFLGDKPYFFGEKPRVLDCAAFAWISAILESSPEKFPLRVFVTEEASNLVNLQKRIKEAYWPDWEEIGKTLDLNTHIPKPPPKTEEDGKEEKKEGDKEKEAEAKTEESKEPEK